MTPPAATRVSARAVAFVYVVSRLLTQPTTYLGRRTIEAHTGIDHTRWPLAEAEVLGLLRTPGVKGDPEGADGWSMEGGQFAPTSVGCPLLPQDVQGGSGSSKEKYFCGGKLSAPAHGCGGKLSAPLSAPTEPSSDLWAMAGRYRYDAWLLHSSAPDAEVTTALVREVLGLDPRSARRLVARMEEVLLVQDGRWNPIALDRAEMAENVDLRLGKAADEMARWLDRRDQNSVPTQVAQGFRRLSSVA